MQSLFARGLAILTALCLAAGVIGFGAVSLDVGFPMYGLAILLMLCWAIKLFCAREVFWKKSPMHVPVMLFCGYAVIRYLTSPIEYDARLELFQVLLLTAMYFLVTSNLHQPRDRAILIWTLMVLALGEAAYGLWQAGVKADKVLGWIRPEGYQYRAGGTFICPNNFAAFLELVLGLVIARAVIYQVHSGSIERRTLHKVVVIYVIVMILAGVIASASRAGWAAVVVGLMLFLFAGDWRPRISLPRVALVLFALGVMGLVVFKWDPGRRLARTLTEQRGQKTVALRDATLGGRIQMWRATVQMIRDHLAFGTGPGTWQWIHEQYKDPTIFGHPENTHNDLLNLTSDYGLIGLLLAVGALACYFRHASLLINADVTSEQRAFALGGMISVAMVLVHCWFDFPLHIPGNALLFVLIMAYTVAIEDPENRFPGVQLTKPARIALGSALLLLGIGGTWFVGSAAMAVRLTSLGNDHKEFLQYDEALYYYQKAIRWDPTYPQPHSKIADVCRTRSLYRMDPARVQERRELARDAIKHYGDALAANPYLAEVWLRLGRAQELAAETNAALQSYRRSIQVAPQNAFAWRTLGQFYHDIGDTNSAAEAYKKSFDLMSVTENAAAQMGYSELRPDWK